MSLVLYWTDVSTRNIWKTDLGSFATSSVDTTPAAKINSGITFDAVGHIVYANGTTGAAGDLRKYDFSSDSLIEANAFTFNTFTGSWPNYMCLEPSGTSVLVTDYQSGHLQRIVLATGATSTLASLTKIGGVCYDSSGRLFVTTINIDSSSTIYRLDPTTGAVLDSLTQAFVTWNSLCFDAGSGLLWSPELQNNVLQPFTPSPLSLGTATASAGLSFINILSGGDGNLYVADEQGNKVYRYRIATTTWTSLFTATGIVGMAFPTVAAVSNFMFDAGGGSFDGPPSNLMIG